MNNFMFNGWAHFIATEAEIQFAMTGLSNNGATIPNGKIRSRPLSFFWGHQFLKLPLPRIRCTQSDTSTMTCMQHVGVKSAIKSTLHAHIRIRRRRLWVSRKFHRASRSLRFKGGCCHPGNEEKKKKNSAQHKENARDIFAWRHNFAKVCGESSCISFLLYLGAAKTSKSSFWDRRKKRIEPEFLPEFQKYA